ncbi:hypothetical protein U1Q18_034619 [Sarracenia purpurea var. burkii]
MMTTGTTEHRAKIKKVSRRRWFSSQIVGGFVKDYGETVVFLPRVVVEPDFTQWFFEYEVYSGKSVQEGASLFGIFGATVTRTEKGDFGKRREEDDKDLSRAII